MLTKDKAAGIFDRIRRYSSADEVEAASAAPNVRTAAAAARVFLKIMYLSFPEFPDLTCPY